VNFIDAAASGAANAISLVANICANLIAFVAILHFTNATLTWFGQRVGVEKLTYEVIAQYLLCVSRPVHTGVEVDKKLSSNFCRLRLLRRCRQDFRWPGSIIIIIS